MNSQKWEVKEFYCLNTNNLRKQNHSFLWATNLDFLKCQKNCVFKVFSSKMFHQNKVSNKPTKKQGLEFSKTVSTCHKMYICEI